MKSLTLVASIVSLISMSSFCSAAKAASINNGGFESGFLGWTIFNENLSPIQSPPSGSPSNSSVRWFETSGGFSPLSNTEIINQFEGQSYAVTDHAESGSTVLYQDITLEPELQHILSFAWFAQSKPPFQDSGSMSLTVSDDPLTNNYQGPVQLFRIDLVPAEFTNFFGVSSDAGILANIVAPVAEPFPVTEWNNVVFDLTPWAGSTVRLAFREAAIGGDFQAGIDAVKVTSALRSVPESNTIFASTIAIGLGVLSKRQLSKRQKV
ncbi:MAG: hypothetical protein KME32_00820 [Mojavia pulchra JT2-VF2]|jgi:hypothetical protein|uniref:PEP-CTERM sorting domain-containing protein n=1 Tax=Mojavia pulchra JT2-VF2 TaxID=287848 RepID=A0A951PVD1_9NOST|nr:hypothetical protein [Mojavia pulchra JT2-VF2]